ncbi:MAG: DUF4864 domain-containing protein [Pseudomonadota bacterium]
MRALATGLIFWIATVFSATAQDAQAPDPGIELTIQSQVDAFLVDDFAQAFTFASPNIQRLFGSAERFGTMVKNGYPMVWRPSEVQFLELRDLGASKIQRVLMRDAKGKVHLLDYQMVQMEGTWRIAGVQLLRTPDVGA